MKTVLLALLVLIVVGFNKDEEGCGCTIISLGANISLKNAVGEDLLDPNNPNSYKERDIETYFLIIGEEKRTGQYDLLFEGNEAI